MDSLMSPALKVESNHPSDMEPPPGAPCNALLRRPEAVLVARSWIGTPYVLRGRVKGAGCDCGTLLAEYLIGIGAAKRADLEDLGFYSHDWFCHESSERYLLRLLRYARRTAETICRPGVAAEPGSLALFRVAGSRIYNHGAIVTAWPRAIHAAGEKVIESDVASHKLTAFREMDVFDPFSKPASMQDSE